MTTKYKFHIFLKILFLWVYPTIAVWPQDEIIKLNQAYVGASNVTACESIRLLPGFSFAATPSKSLTFAINPMNCTISLQALRVSSDKNYIVTITPLDATSNVDFSNGRLNLENNTRALMSVQYYDGLGRPEQLVQVGVTSAKRDLAYLQEYDGFGRESNTWLPGYGKGGGTYTDYATVMSSAKQLNDDLKPYAYPEYEPSPLNRIEKQFSQGEDWHDNQKAVEYAYKTNTVSGDYVCAYYCMSGDNLKRDGNYAANSLFVNEMFDEDGKRSIVFTDKLGQTVLQRSFDRAEPHDTYYVYDDFGNLHYVLSPMASDMLTANGSYTAENDAVKKYGYVYQYDERNRCIEKKLPGCEPVYYVYDKADRLILSQDGEQRAKNPKQWTFNKYDGLGRIIMTGIYKDNAGRSVLATTFKELVITESYDGSSGDTHTGYTNAALPTNTEWLAVNYYDSYRFLGLTALSNKKDSLAYTSKDDYGEKYEFMIDGVDYSAKGLLSGSRTKILDKGRKEIVSAVYYDMYGRVVQAKASNHLDGYEKEYTAYSFTGLPTQKRTEHTASGKAPVVQVHHYEYDHAGRLTKKHRKIGDDLAMNDEKTGEAPVRYEYDELGRMKTRILGRNTSAYQNGLTERYSYNVRSWITGIHSSAFEQTLYYNKPVSTGAGVFACTPVPSYNGNISVTQWKNNFNRNKFGEYIFHYDGLNRLHNSCHTGENNGNFDEYGYFDKNGNPTYIVRSGLSETDYYIDELFIDYNGNQLKSIGDGSSEPNYGSYDFKDRFKQGVADYTYNKNGALTSDYNKMISGIRYNMLNLPDTIQFENWHASYFRYDASGVKRQARYLTAKNNPYTLETGGIITTFPASNVLRVDSTDYCGNVVYENGELKRILTEEGYYEKETTRWGVYFPHTYFLKDHLGNVRVALNIAGTDPDEQDSDLGIVQRTDYYPFGMVHETSTNPDEQPYKYSGKEFDRMHGLDWSDYGARWLMGSVPVWSTVDPLAEKYYSISPYAYCANNPMRFIDFRGDSISVSQELINCFVNYTAFELFATSKEGKNFLADYAAKGQTLFGHTFKKDEKYHKEGLNINYTSAYLGGTRGTTSSGENGNITITLNSSNIIESQDGNTYNWSIGSNKNSSERGKNLTLGTMAKVMTLFHESFIHADLDAKDFMDNKKFDNSNIPSSITSWSSKKHYQHEYVKDSKYSGLWPGAALNGIIEVNSKMGNLYTNDQLNKMIWKYSGGK